MKLKWSLSRTQGYNGPIYRARFADGTEHDVFSPEHHAELAAKHGEGDAYLIAPYNQAPPLRFAVLRRWLQRRPRWYVRLRRWLCARGWLHDRLRDPNGDRLCVWCDR